MHHNPRAVISQVMMCPPAEYQYIARGTASACDLCHRQIVLELLRSRGPAGCADDSIRCQLARSRAGPDTVASEQQRSQRHQLRNLPASASTLGWRFLAASLHGIRYILKGGWIGDNDRTF